MPTLVTDFPTTSGLNGERRLRVSLDDLLWAALTVGKSRRDTFSGTYSVAEMLYRVTCLTAFYNVDSGGRLTWSPAFKTLDPTEKGVVSYYLGMTMAKLFAEATLNIPWMMHVSRYGDDWAIKYGAKANRPDLFGCNDFGQWAVAEAKGRARVSDKLVAKMQQQKSAVATINGLTPSHRYGCATRFERGRLALRVVDPPRRRRAQDVSLDPARWLVDYYAPVVDVVRTYPSHTEDQVTFGLLPGTDVQIGIPTEILLAVDSGRELPPVRRPPRPSAPDGDSRETRRLDEQAVESESRLIVERIVMASREVRNQRDTRGDALVLRSLRGQ